MSRKSLGIAAALLLFVGVLLWWRGPGGENALGLAFGCIRVGLVLAALWLAFPQIVALFGKLPQKILSWLVGGGKPPEKQAAAGEPSQQPLRVKRPRRRSNS